MRLWSATSSQVSHKSRRGPEISAAFRPFSTAGGSKPPAFALCVRAPIAQALAAHKESCVLRYDREQVKAERFRCSHLLNNARCDKIFNLARRNAKDIGKLSRIDYKLFQASTSQSARTALFYFSQLHRLRASQAPTGSFPAGRTRVGTE